MSSTKTGQGQLRVFYAAGGGDVIGTYRHWRDGHDDPSEVALTYSGQFFDVCRELGAEALVITCHHKREDRIDDDRIRIRNRPVPLERRRSPLYQVGQVLYGLRLSWAAWRFGADVAVVGRGTFPFMWSLMAWLGIKVVPTMHVVFWTKNHSRRGRVERIIDRLNGVFWRRWAWATICVSPEIKRQILRIAGTARGPILPVIAQYRREWFDAVDPPPPHDQRPFRIVYAGRVERSKGVFDLVETARRLEEKKPGEIAWEVCGDGSAMEQLRRVVQRDGLSEVVALRGKLPRDRMAEVYGRAHAVFVPTTSDFVEGFNKVAAEGVLAGRPTIVTDIVPAAEVLGEAVVVVEAGQIDTYIGAVRQLADSRVTYERCRAEAGRVREAFFDRGRGWGAAVGSILAGIRDSDCTVPGDSPRRRTPAESAT